MKKWRQASPRNVLKKTCTAIQSPLPVPQWFWNWVPRSQPSSPPANTQIQDVLIICPWSEKQFTRGITCKWNISYHQRLCPSWSSNKSIYYINIIILSLLTPHGAFVCLVTMLPGAHFLPAWPALLLGLPSGLCALVFSQDTELNLNFWLKRKQINERCQFFWCW